MSAENDPKRSRKTARQPRSATPASEPGVLSSLPRTRPQRPSDRRAAARAKREATPASRSRQATPAVGRTKQKTATKSSDVPPRRARKIAKPLAPPLAPPEPEVPRQGFEAEETIEPGRSVQPPSGSELATSVVELVGELAQAGLAAGGRVLRDTLTRLTGA